MKGDTFQPGEEVAISAAFLRSMGTLSFGTSGGSGLSTNDPGIGMVLWQTEGLPDCYEVFFYRDGVTKTYNGYILVRRADIHLEAMRAEHGR